MERGVAKCFVGCIKISRGKLIAFTSHRKKTRHKKWSDLQENLEALEREHIESK